MLESYLLLRPKLIEMKSDPSNGIVDIPIDDIILDVNNPRFGELYNGSEKEYDLIRYLLENEGAYEIVKGIVRAKQFYPDKIIWVVKRGNKYLVKDGNRRCAAVKALQQPAVYELKENRVDIKNVPALIFKDDSELKRRIAEEHTEIGILPWERLSQALYVWDLPKKAQQSFSNYKDLLKIANFYKEAVKIGGLDLKEVLRRGRSGTGGRMIIFERLFRDRLHCGYDFDSTRNHEIIIIDKDRFSSYIIALLNCFRPPFGKEVTARYIDEHREFVFQTLPQFGFLLNATEEVKVTSSSDNQTNQGNTNINENSSTDNSVIPVKLTTQLKPKMRRIGCRARCLFPDEPCWLASRIQHHSKRRLHSELD